MSHWRGLLFVLEAGGILNASVLYFFVGPLIEVLPMRRLLVSSSALALLALLACAPAPEAETLHVETTENTTLVPGVPGGAKQRVSRLTATVKEVDFKNRRVTLQDDQGNIKTMPVPKEAINFDQVKKGDRVTIAYAEELIVYLKDKDAAAVEDAGASLVGRAPAGNKPQAVVAEASNLVATVTAVDLEKHTATLKFANGEVRVVQVRDDVELKKSHVGREVVFHHREATVLSVEKQ